MSTATHHPVDWVRIEKYCEITGETSQSVKNKRTTGIWREGVEFEKKADGVYWYNLEAINRWLQTPIGR